jgi:hypothetical protein
MMHLTLKSCPWIHLCGTRRPQNGQHTTTLKNFRELASDQHCKKCEKLLASLGTATGKLA